MPKFKIACSWEVCGEFEVEAKTLKQALGWSKVVKLEDETSLPIDSEYIDGSFRIDKDMSKYLNKKIDEKK